MQLPHFNPKKLLAYSWYNSDTSVNILSSSSEQKYTINIESHANSVHVQRYVNICMWPPIVHQILVINKHFIIKTKHKQTYISYGDVDATLGVTYTLTQSTLLSQETFTHTMPWSGLSLLHPPTFSLPLSLSLRPSHSFLWFSSPSPPAEHTSPVLLPSPPALCTSHSFFPSIFNSPECFWTPFFALISQIPSLLRQRFQLFFFYIFYSLAFKPWINSELSQMSKKSQCFCSLKQRNGSQWGGWCKKPTVQHQPSYFKGIHPFIFPSHVLIRYYAMLLHSEEADGGLCFLYLEP